MRSAALARSALPVGLSDSVASKSTLSRPCPRPRALCPLTQIHLGAWWVFGDNSDGQLGLGARSMAAQPERSPALEALGAVHVSAGSAHSLAVDAYVSYTWTHTIHVDSFSTRGLV